MKTKIVGITLAAIMLASIFAAFIGSTGAYSTGGPYNIIDRNAAGIQKVLRGQDLEFVNFNTTPTVSRIVDNNIENTYSTTNNRTFDVNWPSTGAYYVNYGAADQKQLSVEDANIPISLKVGTKTVSSLALGSDLKIDVAGINLFDEDHVDLVVIGPDGQIKTDTVNSQTFTNITVGTLASTYGTAGIETAGWKIGTYTFQIKTKADNACGLDKVTDVKTLSIIKGEVDIAAEKTSIVEEASLKLTVTGVSGDNIQVESESTKVEFLNGTEDTPTNSWCTGKAKYCFTDKIDEDGKRTYAVMFTETGSYTIKVTVTAGDRLNTYDTVDISVTEKAVTFDVPLTVTIGSKFTLAGVANTGERVDIAIEDRVYSKTNDIVLDDNGEFSVEIDTASTTDVIQPLTVPGSVRLKAYINRKDKGIGDIGSTESDDGSIAILLVRGDLTATISDPSVAQGDDFTISGIAKGSKSVNIMIVSPKGSGGDYIDGTDQGIYDTTSSISETDNSFTKKINVGDDVDTGTYVIAVLSPGSDSVYNGLVDATTANLKDKLDGSYNLQAKTQEQLLEILQDATVDAAGSDDLLVLLTVKVEAAFVRLDPVATVGVGAPMVVSGSTNREEGFAIVVTAKGPTELTPKTVMVENGKFNATFDTTGAKEGMYTVKADDGDGHTDEVTASISGTAPSPTATVSPTATPATPTPTMPPTPTPATPTPATPTPATPTPEEPGFEAVFAIAGLLALAYLVLRIRK
jgi:PGF-CTERM protein